MKHNSSKTLVDTSAHNSLESQDWSPELEENDPVWNLLSQASERKPDPFFARNVVRSARLDENPSNYRGTWFSHVTSFFTARRLILGAAACACALVTYPMWPNSEAPGAEMATSPQPSPTVTTSAVDLTAVATNELSELVIAETLDAAAEDPSIFTRDEVVAMIGF